MPQNYGPNVTVLAALGLQGLQAMMTVEGATDAAVFRAYVKDVLGPTLAPGDIVVLDNLRAYKAVGIQQLLARLARPAPLFAALLAGSVVDRAC